MQVKIPIDSDLGIQPSAIRKTKTNMDLHVASGKFHVSQKKREVRHPCTGLCDATCKSCRGPSNGRIVGGLRVATAGGSRHERGESKKSPRVSLTEIPSAAADTCEIEIKGSKQRLHIRLLHE